VFVADVIPSELKRVIEFLNEQMNPAEVVGIEVKQFAGGTFRTLAARMIGVTEQAREQRRVRTRRGVQREWDEQSFFVDLGERADMAAVDVASRILEWARSQKYDIQWLGGALDGRMQVSIRIDERGASHVWSPFYVWTYGKIEMRFKRLGRQPPFDDGRLQREFLKRLAPVEGLDFPEDAFGRRPPIPLSLLEPESSYRAFTSAIEWFASVVKTGA